MSKNIVVFADGTNNEGGEGASTNVYKLFNMVLDRTPEKQIAFYDPGIGTDKESWLGSLTGAGIQENIKDCYDFIHSHYNAGDRLFLFGFSRGATTVRSLSGFIHHFGILPLNNNELFKKAWKIYEDKKIQRRARKIKEFNSKHHTMWAKIDFLGVWDTVAALGSPNKFINKFIDATPFWKHKYHDLRLSSSVVNGRHALAIDEKRKSFLPNLWEAKKKDFQSIKQVWFCGMHSDVGGGYAEQGLSDIALNWMISEGVSKGLLIYDKHKVSIKSSSDGFMHDSRTTIFKLQKPVDRSWNESTHGKMTIHKSVIDRINNKSNNYSPWIQAFKYEVEGE